MDKIKIVYCTPSIYIAGGVERVLTTKVNYLASQADKYDVTIILTDGADKPPFYELSDKVKVINLDIGFEELWELSFLKKIPVYLKKQRQYKKKLTDTLMTLRPDITVSTLRREINFLCDIPDGSRKIGEMHINRLNYRNFEEGGPLKRLFSRWWMWRLVRKLRRLDKMVVLTDDDRRAWSELNNVCVIPNPLPAVLEEKSKLKEKRVIAVGRYTYQKGFDLLLRAWAKVQQECPDWRLDIFGAGETAPYQQLADELGLDKARYALNGPTKQLTKEYLASSVFALSSRFEGFGMVILEAMSCGLPVVSFDCPCGPKTLIVDGTDGLLVENGNTDSLAKGIIRLIKDENLRKALADRAKEKSRSYSIEVIGKQWEQLFIAGQAQPTCDKSNIPLITIAIPVYHVEDYVQKSVESALAQTYTNIEVLILDDCGSDQSMSIVEQIQETHPRGHAIRIVRQPRNMGIGAARNRLIREAQGAYLYFLDGDDTIEPHTISILYDALSQHHAELCFGSHRRIEDYAGHHRTEECCYAPAVFDNNKDFGLYAFRKYNGIGASSCNILTEKDFFVKNDLWFLDIQYWEDMTMTMRIPLYACRVVFLSDVTYHYHCHANSLSNFEHRTAIPKEEIEQTADALDEVKRQTASFSQRPYYPLLLNKLLMTGFYIVCNIIQKKDVITPSFTAHELRRMMWSPVSLSYVMKRKPKRMANMFLSLIGLLPSCLSVAAITLLGRAKGLIK